MEWVVGGSRSGRIYCFITWIMCFHKAKSDCCFAFIPHTHTHAQTNDCHHCRSFEYSHIKKWFVLRTHICFTTQHRLMVSPSWALSSKGEWWLVLRLLIPSTAQLGLMCHPRVHCAVTRRIVVGVSHAFFTHYTPHSFQCNVNH
jgi:hypothetical protein